MNELTIEQLRDDLKSLKIVGDSQEAREAFWRLRDNYARTARLALALDAQLQQEREGREKLREALSAIEREAVVAYMSAFNQGPAAETIVRLARAALAQIQPDAAL